MSTPFDDFYVTGRSIPRGQFIVGLVEALVKAAQDSRTSEDMLTAEWRASFSLRAASVLSAHWPQGDIHAASALGEPSK